MRTDRLERLITILEGVPPEQFDLAVWDCGTAACAIGWAARDAQFRAEGLTMSEAEARPIYTVEGETLDGFDAVEVFFELTRDQARRLFYVGAYLDSAEPRDVIARIRELVLDYQCEQAVACSQYLIQNTRRTR